MREYCDEHKQTRSDMLRVEHRIDIYDTLIEQISRKLNLILGGIIISPFIVALLTLLTKKKF